MSTFLNDSRKIEEKSFQIIRSRLEPKVPPEEIADIIFRIIHTTADFDLIDRVEFKNDPIRRGLKALSDGTKIYADTRMIAEGVNRSALKCCGSEIVNFVHDKDVIRTAQESGVTRSTLAIRKALKDPKINIFAIGNAPTALFTLIDEIEQTERIPGLIIGVPVGFVGASESKKELNRLDRLRVPYIRINGEKGGSTIAVAVLNALLYRLGRKW